MLRKCLKYDLKALISIWKYISVLTVIASVMCGLSIRVFETMDDKTKTITVLFAMFGIMASMLVFYAYMISTVAFGVYRYYKKCYTDEGYLTFTLPVKRVTTLNSKLISALILSTASALILFVALNITMAIVPTDNTDFANALTEFYGNASKAFKEAYDANGFWIVAIIAEIVIGIFTSEVGFTLLLFSIAARVPSMKRNVKLTFLKGFIVFIAYSLFSTLLSFGSLFIIFYVDAMAVSGGVKPNEIVPIIFFGLLIACMASLICTAWLYRDNLRMMREKLNLG